MITKRVDLNASKRDMRRGMYNSIQFKRFEINLQHPTRQLFSNLFSVWAFWLRRSTSCCCLRNRPISRTKKQQHGYPWPHLGTNCILGGCATGAVRLFFDGHSMIILPYSSSQLSKTFGTLISFEFLGYPWCLPIDSSIAGFRSQPQAGQLHQRKQEVLKTAESHSKIF